MGVSYSTAKWLAPTTFVIDFVAQQYGMLSSPNMLDIHNANPSFFSPQPYFIGAFFFPQQLLQLVWLYRLYRLSPSVPAERAELDRIMPFVPYYSLGNACIATWMLFWNANNLQGSMIFVTINSLAQLFYVSQMSAMDTSSTSDVLTHLVAKTFAGIGVLDLLHNGSAGFFKNQSPSLALQVLTGVGFGLASSVSDWIFGGCLVYDLVALAVGQTGTWRSLLAAYAVGSAAIVTARNLARPPYTRSKTIAGDEDETENEHENV